MGEHKIAKVSVIWRGKQLNVEIGQSCNVKEFGQILQDLTNVKPDTLKLLVPQSEKKSSKLVAPFSDVNSSLSLQDAGIIQVVILFHHLEIATWGCLIIVVLSLMFLFLFLFCYSWLSFSSVYLSSCNLICQCDTFVRKDCRGILVLMS